MQIISTTGYFPPETPLGYSRLAAELKHNCINPHSVLLKFNVLFNNVRHNSSLELLA